MSLEDALDFARKASSDAALAARVTTALQGSVCSAAATAFAELGREEGFDFTPEEAAEARNRVLQSLAMPEKDLDQVAGGGERNNLASLVATNLLGQNTPAIASTEAAYEQMWAQDAAAMTSYAPGSSATTAPANTAQDIFGNW